MLELQELQDPAGRRIFWACLLKLLPPWPSFCPHNYKYNHSNHFYIYHSILIYFQDYPSTSKLLGLSLPSQHQDAAWYQKWLIKSANFIQCLFMGAVVWKWGMSNCLFHCSNQSAWHVEHRALLDWFSRLFQVSGMIPPLLNNRMLSCQVPFPGFHSRIPKKKPTDGFSGGKMSLKTSLRLARSYFGVWRCALSRTHWD